MICMSTAGTPSTNPNPTAFAPIISTEMFDAVPAQSTMFAFFGDVPGWQDGYYRVTKR